MSILAQSPINVHTVAYNFGQQDAEAGDPCVPEMVFLQRKQQVEYAAGYESVKGVTVTTAQFTGSELPKPVVHKTRNNGGEYVRYTDLCADKAIKAHSARQRRLEAMAAKTAAESPYAAGDILWL